MTGRRSIPISGIIVALFLVGCVTGKAPAPDSANTPLASQPEIAPALLQAQQLYEENRFAAALTSYIEVRRRLPETPGLEAMRQKILTAIEEERVQQTVRRNKLSEQQMATEAMEKSEVPETYGAKLYVKRVLTTHRRPPGTMQKVLETPVTIHLQQPHCQRSSRPSLKTARSTSSLMPTLAQAKPSTLSWMKFPSVTSSTMSPAISMCGSMWAIN